MADPRSVHKWDCANVAKWLKQQGYNDSIQNKFISEYIDGKALLSLNTNDVNKLLHNRYSLDCRAKISSAVRTLQNHLQKSNNLTRNLDAAKRKNPRKRQRYHIDSSNYLLENYSSSSENDYRRKRIKRSIMQCMSSNTTDSSTDSVSSIYFSRVTRQIQTSNTNNSTTENNSEKNKIKKRNIEMHNRNNNNNNITNNHNVNNQNEEVSDDNSQQENDEKKQEINKQKRQSKKSYKRYSNDHKHNISNLGKRWIENDLELMWGLHKKGYSNMKLAEHFKRTECGIMVQIDKKYKEIRDNERMAEIVDYRRKKIEQLCNGSDDASSSDDDELIINRIRRQQH